MVDYKHNLKGQKPPKVKRNKRKEENRPPRPESVPAPALTEPDPAVPDPTEPVPDPTGLVPSLQQRLGARRRWCNATGSQHQSEQRLNRGGQHDELRHGGRFRAEHDT